MNIQNGTSIQYFHVTVPVAGALDSLFACFTCFLLYHLTLNKMVVLNINSAAHTIFFKEGGKIIVITVNWQVMNEKKSSKISLEEDPNARACKGKVFFLPAVLKSQKKTNPPQPPTLKKLQQKTPPR